MALQPVPILTPDAFVLAAAVALDLAIGDPVYRAHPVRLIGRTLQAIESTLRRIGADGYAGGVVLTVALSVLWVGGLSLALVVLFRIHPSLGWALHLFLLYSLLALGDLLVHGRRIDRALGRGDLVAAKAAVSQLVGRDTDRMDDAACRRAAVESLSENLTDGFTSPLFWYAAGGIPGLVLFKVVSTMDSMVGYKTPRYLRFGWSGARLDDVMNYVPARLTFALLAVVAAVMPSCSGRKAVLVGLSQHALLPGPNSGWSEAATAGAVQRRLAGPIWMNGRQVTNVWLGDAGDPPLATADDYRRASAFIACSGATAAFAACVICWMRANWR
jgi:adenosylcobinamide-phosphate synthase